MKLQDVIFIILLALVVFKRNPKISTILGLCCLLFAIPLFAKWIFFTAERLTWYAAGFFLVSIILYLFFQKKKV